MKKIKFRTFIFSRQNIDTDWSSDAKYFDFSINSDIEDYDIWKYELGRYVSACRNSNGSYCKHLIYTSGKYHRWGYPMLDEEGYVFEGQGELSCMWDPKKLRVVRHGRQLNIFKNFIHRP